MISAADAALYLDEVLGVSVPQFILDATVAAVGALEADMVSAGYSAPTITRMQAMAVALLAGADFARRIASQAAPSGASRSFKNLDQAVSALRRQLAALDTAGVVADLIGPDPSTNTLLMVTC